MSILVPRTVTPLVLAIASILWADSTQAQNYYDLLRRVPDSPNALILIDFEALLQSPVAVRENWADMVESRSRSGLSVPPDTKSLVKAARVDWAGGLQSAWDVAVIEAGHVVTPQKIAESEASSVDEVAGLPVVYSHRDAFFVSLAPKVVGVMFPANRQELARWARGIEQRKEPSLTPYLDDVVVLAHGRSHYVAAMDLEYLLSPSTVRAQLQESRVLADKDYDLETFARILAGVRGLVFTADAGETLEGKLRVDFSEPVAPLKEFAKPLLLGALENQGIMVPEFKDWRLRLEPRSIIFEGRVSPGMLETLSSLVSIPAVNLPTDGDSPGEEKDPKPAANLRYFRQVNSYIDDLKVKGKHDSDRVVRTWADRFAQEIDRLPILNVDPDLIDFGTKVAQTFRNIRNLSIGAKLDEDYRRASITNGYGVYGGYGGVQGGATQLQATQIRKAETAALKANQVQVWTALEEGTSEMRKTLTQRYMIEF